MPNWTSPVYHAGVSTGTALAAGTNSTATTIPTDANGTTARACLFSATNTSGAFIRLGASTTSTTATTGDIFISSQQPPLALVTRGMSAFAALRATAAQPVNVQASPIEDG